MDKTKKVNYIYIFYIKNLKRTRISVRLESEDFLDNSLSDSKYYDSTKSIC